MAHELVELGFRLKGMNLAASKQSSILFFDAENQENVVSGWKWAVTLAAKVYTLMCDYCHLSYKIIRMNH